MRLAVGACGVRYKGRTDVCLMELAPGTSIAGVLTRSLSPSAPVDWCRKALKGGRARAILVNSGNANAFTGRLGKASVDRCLKATAGELACTPTEVFVASTGVIGEPLPDERITQALPGLIFDLDADRWAEAAAAIMTTDTFPKTATRTARIGGAAVRINGIAKGSGMIAPDMATMLAFAATDAKLPAGVLRGLLEEAAGALLQLHHGGRRYLHQRHPAAGSDGCGAGSPPASPRPATDVSPISRPSSRT